VWTGYIPHHTFWATGYAVLLGYFLTIRSELDAFTCYPTVNGWLMSVFEFSSVQISLFSSSSQRKSQWKTNLRRWALSPAQNWLRLMDGERRWSGSEFQTTGAAIKKLRLPSIIVLVRGTNAIATLGIFVVCPSLVLRSYVPSVSVGI